MHLASEISTRSDVGWADQIARLTFDQLPAEVVGMAKCSILDTIGVGIGGAAEPTCTLLRKVQDPSSGQSSVWGVQGAVGSMNAAQANGVAAHALDFDDLAKPSMGGHPSAPLLPAILAVAEQEGKTGAELITAFVAGYETQCRLGTLMLEDHVEHGFHATATMGVVGAAAGVARLLGLDAQRAFVAMSLASAHVAGLKRMFGTMGKPLQVGNAARSGVQAALLAREGYTAAEDFLHGPQGFLEAYAGAGSNDSFAIAPEDRWYILDTIFKDYASCFGTHSTIDAIQELQPQIPQLSDIEKIQVTFPPGHQSVCCIERPRTGLEAKFSINYALATTLVNGDASPERFTDEQVAAGKVEKVYDLIKLVPDPSEPELGSKVRITLKDGRELVARRDCIAEGNARSSSEHWERLVPKFRSLVDPVLGSKQAGQLLNQLKDIESAETVAGLSLNPER